MNGRNIKNTLLKVADELCGKGDKGKRRRETSIHHDGVKKWKKQLKRRQDLYLKKTLDQSKEYYVNYSLQRGGSTRNVKKVITGAFW